MRLHKVGWLLAPALLWACGSDSSDEDTHVSQDTSETDVPSDTATPDVEADTSDLVVPPDTQPDNTPDTVEPGSVKAFVIEEDSQLLTGPQAIGRKGDFRIENSHFVAVIGAAGHSLWGPYGGGLLDLAPAGEADHYEEQFPMAGFLRTVKVENIEVAQDGSNGEAIIRVTGPDGPIPLVASLVPVAAVGVQVTVEYVVKEDSECLEIRTTIANDGEEKITVPVGDALLFTETGKTVGPGAGFDMAGLMSSDGLAWIGADDADMSFLLAPAEGKTLKLALTQDELTIVTYDSLKIFPGSKATLSRCMYPGKGRTVGVLSTYLTSRGTALQQVTGQVAIDTEGYDFTRLSLDISKDGQYYGSANPDATGAFDFLLPEGTYTAVLSGPAITAMNTQFTVEAGKSTTPFSLDPADPGRIDVKITDADGQAMAARIMAQAGAEATYWDERVAVVPDLKGEATLFLPAGDYTIQGSRGAEYSFCRVAATVAAGQKVDATCKLDKVMDLTGYTPADLHVHSDYGIDSEFNHYERVKAEVVEGLRFWAATDHDIFEDYSSIVAELGLQDVIVPSIGIEVSPIGRHFNGLGCKPALTEFLKYFVVPWTNFLPNGEVSGSRLEPELWKSMHDDFSCRVVQVNHPRDTQGYFDLVNYDPAVGPASATAGRFDMTFDAVEIWNSTDDWNHLATATLPDWYSFLNRGFHVIATGNPDTHALTQWASQPHNVVKVDGELNEENFYDALLAGHTQVTSAPFIEFEIDGVSMGDTVQPSGGTAHIEIKVSAPGWAPLDKVQLIGNGELVQEWDVTGLTDVVRLEQTLDLTPTVDTWYVVVAFDADNDLAPLYPGRSSAAVSNPIWVDLNGDGFNPPIVD